MNSDDVNAKKRRDYFTMVAVDCSIRSLSWLLVASVGSLGARRSRSLVPMKVIGETHEYAHADDATVDRHSGRVSPRAFAGPEQFRLVVGKCWDMEDDQIWGEWVIEDNTLVGMNMENGDVCADGRARAVQVVVSCGEKAEVRSVRETQPCRYLLDWRTRLACGPNSMSVLAALSSSSSLSSSPPELKERIHRAQRLFRDGILTKIGLERVTRAVCAEAGLLVVGQVQGGTMEEQQQQQETQQEPVTTSFTSLAECQLAFSAMRQNLQTLQQPAAASCP
ncbi:unnamed protein product [Notodromas monacha]|uniref:MRH domain-containing protein n=1 Tax=Notodromas monacha TaxID=399045 RepID=A0A7R9BTY0_9CRUS|nr:unnamed protein product [Notodromas monacha]CAG0920303.1 unnamed protein product [Notodromas monacha]